MHHSDNIIESDDKLHVRKGEIKMKYFFEMACKFDSKSLYREIERFKANVMDMGKVVYIYGEAEESNVDSIITTCSKYGRVEMQGGGMNVKEEETQV